MTVKNYKLAVQSKPGHNKTQENNTVQNTETTNRILTQKQYC